MSHIFIIGYMLAGKTSYGKSLAGLKEMPFIDLDAEIEARTGKSITDIFKDEGETAFRQIEHATLTELCQLAEPHIISCGGGTPCFYDNIEIMKQHGHIIYLQTPLSTILLRAYSERKNRPLLAEISDDELPNFIASQIKEREKFYLQADETTTFHFPLP